MAETLRPPGKVRNGATPAYIVGIGASAGGIEALQEFFRHVPAEAGPAYVVILHLSPDHDSQLAQVLQQTAPIPVTQVTGRVEIEANRVYVVPPNKLLQIDGQAIVVEEMTRAEERRAPVDMFFRSLADAQGSRSVCVVLSGTGPNGSAGLKRVKEYGGLVVVQEPETAKYGDMPRNAIATGLVDLILPIAEMPGRIGEFHQRLSADRDQPLPSPRSTNSRDAMLEVLAVLRIRTGHDFSNYKPGTIQRRVARRMHLRGLPDLPSYARLLREHPQEALALMKELLISVTNFFRDAPAFDALTARVLPRIFSGAGRQDQIRVWVPGCATGEEAYTIAMLLAEHAAMTIEQPGIQIFATDLDEDAIASARDGFYTNSDVADVSEERLLRFFVREPGGYRVRRDLRETVLFATHNVIRDPPFSHLDLVSCRNLLIYLNRTVQERVVETFHFALRSGGFLFLAPSESPEAPADLFMTVDKSAHIYESRAVAPRLLIPSPDSLTPLPRIPIRPTDGRLSDRISPGELHQRLLERYAPPSLVVTEDHHVVHMSDGVGRFLQVTGGEPSRDLLRMARPELRPDLRTALHQATREGRTVEIKGVTANLDDGDRSVDVAVHPVLRQEDPSRGYLLVTFDARDGAADQPTTRLVSPAEPMTLQMEAEISRLKHQLRMTIEQYETQAEEAKASNEELQAMNEELRSSAEELETSKEELQSVNEELTTVNQELKIKIEELGLANNDFLNLINSSDIGTIFLDRRMRVKLFTPAATQVFNLLRGDIGRALSDITTTLTYDGLFNDIRLVLDELRMVDRECATRDGRWIFARLRPYRTTDDRIDGVVITLHDVTTRRHAEEQLRKGEERLRLLIDGATDYAIFTMSREGVIDSWNTGAERMFQYRADEIIGHRVDELFTAEDRADNMPARDLEQAGLTGRAADERFHVRKDGTRFCSSGMTLRLGHAFGFAKIARDLSTQQQATEALRIVQADFDLRVRERTGELEAEVTARAAAHHHIAVLLQRIVTAQEDERARIARDLHDQLGQQLTALRLTLQRHHERLAAGEATPEDVTHALALAERVDGDLDFLAWELRPAALDDLGLAAALPAFVREWSEHYNIPVEYQSGTLLSGQLARDAEVVFYRIAQEALNNVLKHAHASRVDLLLEIRDGSVLLLIEDNGVGFDITEKDARDKGIGIVGMQERASLVGASLQIESQPGQGTSVYLRAPMSTTATAGEPR